jgi:hypothetical protein
MMLPAGFAHLKRCGTVLVVHRDESSQFSLQLRHAGEYATVQGTALQLSKPTFNGIQP